MSELKGTITINAVKERVPEKRMISGNRYVLSGNPRRGGTATVWSAYDIHEDRKVAIKLFRASVGPDDVSEESFRRETRALSDLRHPNIVRIFDSGLIQESNEHFIVMEWVDEDLEKYRLRSPFESWSQYFDQFGRPILEAIRFAQEHRIAHRDIKPSNILVLDGIPKLCDFGISKIRNYFEPGVTLRHYASMPYAPPEPDDGSHSFARDVFGFAALSAAMFCDAPPQNYGDLLGAIEKIECTDKTKHLLRQCLSLDSPDERPANAAFLLARFEDLLPRQASPKLGGILLALTKAIRTIIAEDTKVEDDLGLQRFFNAELADARVVSEPARPRPDGSIPDTPQIKIYGDLYVFIGVETDEKDKLLLVTAFPSNSYDATAKESAYSSPYSFTLAHEKQTRSKLNIRSLQNELREYSATQRALEIESRSQAIFIKWQNMLAAKSEFEKQRRRPVEFVKWEHFDSGAKIILASPEELSAFEERDIKIDIGDDVIFRGTVTAVLDDGLFIHRNERSRLEVDSISAKGHIAIDTEKTDASIEKEKSALEAIRLGRSVNPVLGALISDPNQVAEYKPVEIDFIQEDIDEDKQDVVKIAMGNPDLLLVQGPPGTGKTTFISELVLQVLRRDPDARILLTSQTHVALDNCLERIMKLSHDLQAIRIGRDTEVKIAFSVRPLLLDNKLREMRKEALRRGSAFLEKWAGQNDADLNYAKMVIALERYAWIRDRADFVDHRISELEQKLSSEERTQLEPEAILELEQELGELSNERRDIGRETKESYIELGKFQSDAELLEHWRSCDCSELRSWAENSGSVSATFIQLRKLLKIHVDWESRFGRSEEFRAALISSSQVIAGTCLGIMGIPGRNEIEYDLCIVDEASIASPTQVMVPMSRARRTVLVGDSNQLSPFDDPELKESGLLEQFELVPEDMKETLFNHLSEGLPAGLRKTLTTQHRMLKPIGDLISECFYGGQLKSKGRAAKNLLASVLPKPVVWLSTAKLQNRASERIGTTCANDCEVSQIVSLLDRFNTELSKQKNEKPISIAVLTGYSEQRIRLRAAIDRKRAKWGAIGDIYVNVVDAFQGRDADVAIFSVTRSDKGGLGFLKEMERINVALSRGKEYLVIVGDHFFCQKIDAHSNPLKNVLSYITSHPADCQLVEVAK